MWFNLPFKSVPGNKRQQNTQLAPSVSAYTQTSQTEIPFNFLWNLQKQPWQAEAPPIATGWHFWKRLFCGEPFRRWDRAKIFNLFLAFTAVSRYGWEYRTRRLKMAAAQNKATITLGSGRRRGENGPFQTAIRVHNSPIQRLGVPSDPWRWYISTDFCLIRGWMAIERLAPASLTRLRYFCWDSTRPGNERDGAWTQPGWARDSGVIRHRSRAGAPLRWRSATAAPPFSRHVDVAFAAIRDKRTSRENLESTRFTLPGPRGENLLRHFTAYCL